MRWTPASSECASPNVDVGAVRRPTKGTAASAGLATRDHRTVVASASLLRRRCEPWASPALPHRQPRSAGPRSPEKASEHGLACPTFAEGHARQRLLGDAEPRTDLRSRRTPAAGVPCRDEQVLFPRHRARRVVSVDGRRQASARGAERVRIHEVRARPQPPAAVVTVATRRHGVNGDDAKRERTRPVGVAEQRA